MARQLPPAPRRIQEAQRGQQGNSELSGQRGGLEGAEVRWKEDETGRH